MARLRFFSLALLLALAAPVAAGCSSSHTSGDDAGITVMIDAMVLPDGFVMPPGPVCGNGAVEAMEQCDDGNTAAGDGCDPTCRREPYCGDGDVSGAEVCDDGNNRSNDGCRSDCLSNEECGNGIVDYVTGEVCDGGAMCTADCRTLMGCGDGTVEAPEQCDDGVMPPARWDGCGADCRDEISMLVEDLQFGTPTVGCDYSGDGMPDNRFSRALGPAAALLNMLIGGGGGGGGGAPTFLMSFMGLDDATGAMDDSLRVAWMTGEAGPSPGTFLVDSNVLEADGTPITSLQGEILARMLDAGPEDIDLPLGFLPLTLEQGRVQGTTVASGGELSGVSDGLLCGVVGPALLTLVNADLLEMFGGGGGGGFMIDIGDPCDGSTEPATLFDMMVGGAQISFLRIGNVRPDVDLDGDGLESYEVTSTGPDGCQAVITGCIDGDGTRFEGRNCINEVEAGRPRFVDGYSTGLTYTATRTEIVGTTAGGEPPPEPLPGG
jgi:cysteine-rich repeat protein